MKGAIKITKVFRDGTRELICEDNNILTDGLGYSIANMFTDSGEGNISDHIVGYFQVGTGKHNPDTAPVGSAKYISTLKNPLLSEGAYGENAEIKIDTHKIIMLHEPNMTPPYTLGTQDGVFAFLPDSHSTKLIDGVVHYRLTLTEEMVNNVGEDITEFGLFSRNTSPEVFAQNKEKDNTSLLIAYKNFPGLVNVGVRKSNDFSLVIDWQVKFVDSPLEEDPLAAAPKNVVFIMIDDVGVDQLGMYDSLNPYEIANVAHPDATPFSQVDDPTNGSGIYPHTPTLSALGAEGMTFFNTRTQPACTPTRGCLLSGRYNFSVVDHLQSTQSKGLDATVGFWGAGLGMVADGAKANKRERSGLRGLNDGFKHVQYDGERRNLTNSPYVRDKNHKKNTILSTPIITDYLHRSDVNYQAALFGKWHVATWSQQDIYCEFDLDGNAEATIKGRGWPHIQLKGKWDYWFANFSNLNSGPIPGYNYEGGVFEEAADWPNEGGNAGNATDGKQMGFVNYFVASGSQTQPRNPGGEENIVSENIFTVSDSGYRTYNQVDGTTPYEQGDPSSYNTNYVLSAASAYFNTTQEPFVMYISPNTPHTPYTYPPSGSVYTEYYNSHNRYSELSAGMSAADSVSTTWVTTNAMLENFDHALSGFLEGLDQSKKDNTIFIVTSDNGPVITDMRKRASWASSIGLGAGATLGQNPADSGGGGFGATYDKMFNLGAFCSGLTPPNYRRGGESDAAWQYKASLYDRGILVPMIVSGLGVSAGTTTSALVDINDLIATVMDLAGALGEGPESPYNVPPDSVSFKDIFYGNTDASSHPRQYSYSEVFFPLGTSMGDTTKYGTWSSSLLCGEQPFINTLLSSVFTPDEGPIGTNTDAIGNIFLNNLPQPHVPRRRRQSLIVRFKPNDFSNYFPQNVNQVINHLVAEETIDEGDVTLGAAGDDQRISDASAGLWKIIRPSSGRISVANPAVDTDEFEPTEYLEYTLGKGQLFEEIYHLQESNFASVDPYELHDYILEETKGVSPNFIVSALIVSAITNSVAEGGLGGAGSLDNTVFYWNVARIFDALHRCLSSWLQYRYTPETTMSLLTGAPPPNEELF